MMCSSRAGSTLQTFSNCRGTSGIVFAGETCVHQPGNIFQPSEASNTSVLGNGLSGDTGVSCLCWGQEAAAIRTLLLGELLVLPSLVTVPCGHRWRAFGSEDHSTSGGLLRSTGASPANGGLSVSLPHLSIVHHVCTVMFRIWHWAGYKSVLLLTLDKRVKPLSTGHMGCVCTALKGPV